MDIQKTTAIMELNVANVAKTFKRTSASRME